MKVVSEPLIVECRDGLPWRIIRQGKPFRIKLARPTTGQVENIEDSQTYAGKWWLSPNLQPMVRKYYLVEARWRHGALVTMEIYEEHGQWRLSRISD